MPESRPNIILIMADDLGFSDLGSYGSEIDTPALNQMSQEGVRFTQGYNYARCCPTRASLLTGLYPHQAGVGYMTSTGSEIPSYQGYLREDCVTIAEALKENGYNTGMSGKWHVGGGYRLSEKENWNPGDESHPTPTQRGFDRFYGTLAGAGSYYNPHTMMEGEEFLQVGPKEDFYYTDKISAKASEMIECFQSENEPFFLYVSYTAPHWPLHALPEDIKKYRNTYRDGWDEIRKKRYKRLIDLELIDEKWEISPRNNQAKSWKDVEYQEWEAARMAVYAAQVDRMDQGIGTITAKLEELGIEDETLIVFLSDNGGCAELLKEEASWLQDMVNKTRKGEVVVPGNDPNRMPGGEDTYMSYGLPWANVSNTPFRLFKHWVHEGGIATPLIVKWPQGIVDKMEGSIFDDGKTPLHVIDFMPTFLEAAGGSYPKQRQGVKLTPVEGESWLPLLKGENWSRERPLFWEHEGNKAIRDGRWKLVSQYPSKWELYDMKHDRTELQDLSSECKGKVAELKNNFEKWRECCEVLKWEEVQRILG